MAINVKDLNRDTRAKLGLRRFTGARYAKDDVRTDALRALEPIAHLTRSQRRRVLEHAMKLNDV